MFSLHPVPNMLASEMIHFAAICMSTIFEHMLKLSASIHLSYVRPSFSIRLLGFSDVKTHFLDTFMCRKNLICVLGRHPCEHRIRRDTDHLRTKQLVHFQLEGGFLFDLYWDGAAVPHSESGMHARANFCGPGYMLPLLYVFVQFRHS